MLKRIIKLFIPPIIYRMKDAVSVNSNLLLWSGQYENWKSASARSQQYDDALILDKVRNALLKVKNGIAAYERDSVLFDKMQYPWPMLACLQKIALENHNKLTVLDFGGSLGSSYFQNRGFLSSISLSWNVVEQPSFVEAGQKEFEDGSLKFYHNIEDLKTAGVHPDCIILSSVIQYLETPDHWIKKLSALSVKYILIDRTGFIEGDKEILTVQSVPAEIYPVSYPCWFFNEEDFLKKISNYSLIVDFDDTIDAPVLVNGLKAYWKGFLLRLND